MSLEVVHSGVTPIHMIFEEKVDAGGRNYFPSTRDRAMAFLDSNTEFLLQRKLKIPKELQLTLFCSNPHDANYHHIMNNHKNLNN